MIEVDVSIGLFGIHLLFGFHCFFLLLLVLENGVGVSRVTVAKIVGPNLAAVTPMTLKLTHNQKWTLTLHR
jgi:hypothetical protein